MEESGWTNFMFEWDLMAECMEDFIAKIYDGCMTCSYASAIKCLFITVN